MISLTQIAYGSEVSRHGMSRLHAWYQGRSASEKLVVMKKERRAVKPTAQKYSNDSSGEKQALEAHASHAAHTTHAAHAAATGCWSRLVLLGLLSHKSFGREH